VTAVLAQKQQRCSGGGAGGGSGSGSGGAGGLPDLTKLSPCALKCVTETVASAGCSGPTDTACICTEKFTNAASGCLMSQCETKDVLAALDLERTMCPDLGLPDLSSLNECSQGCILESMKASGCSGPLDKGCVCGAGYSIQAALCLLSDACGLGQVPKALKVEKDMCYVGSAGKCESQGVFKVLDLDCWIQRDKRSVEGHHKRRGTSVARAARHNMVF
jgi:hypothetical protein